MDNTIDHYFLSSMDTLAYYKIIFEIVKLIPKGRVCSYGVIAHNSGAGITARMVGRAMSASHESADVPAHRVVNSQGKLTGKMHFETPTQMQELLESEGVIIKNDKVQDFDTIFWNPQEIGFDM